jgi:hypothetical protein
LVGRQHNLITDAMVRTLWKGQDPIDIIDIVAVF